MQAADVMLPLDLHILGVDHRSEWVCDFSSFQRIVSFVLRIIVRTLSPRRANSSDQTR